MEYPSDEKNKLTNAAADEAAGKSAAQPTTAERTADNISASSGANGLGTGTAGVSSKNAMTQKTASLRYPNGITVTPNGAEIVGSYYGDTPAENPQRYGGTTVVANGAQIVGGGTPTAAITQEQYATENQGLKNVSDTLSGAAYGLNSGTIKTDNNGNITINGTDTGLKASDYANGVAGNEKALAEAYAKATGDKSVLARVYANSLSGLGDLVQWSDGKVTIGGIDVPYQYIDGENQAYVSQSAIDKAIEEARKIAGTDKATTINDNIYNKYSDTIDKLSDKVYNPKEWSYSPNSDPAYQAYAKMYQQNAEQAYNRAMGSGGLYSSPTSYQMYQALAGYGDNMQNLSQAIPTLQQQDYNRFSDARDREVTALNAATAERQQALNDYLNANETERNFANNANATDYARRADAVYNYPMTAEKLAQTQQQTLQSDEATKQAQQQTLQANEATTQAQQQTQLGSDQVKQSAVYTEQYPSILALDKQIKQEQLTAAQVENLINRIKAANDRAVVNGGEYLPGDMNYLGISPNMSKYPDTNGYPTVWQSGLEQKAAEWEIEKRILLEKQSLGIG